MPVFLSTLNLNCPSVGEAALQFVRFAYMGETIVSRLIQAGQVTPNPATIVLFEQGIEFHSGIKYVGVTSPFDVLCDASELAEVKPVVTFARSIVVPALMVEVMGVLFRQQQPDDLPVAEQMEPILLKLMLERLYRHSAAASCDCDYDEEPLAFANAS
jgi:hypothetical protein